MLEGGREVIKGLAESSSKNQMSESWWKGFYRVIEESAKGKVGKRRQGQELCVIYF